MENESIQSTSSAGQVIGIVFVCGVLVLVFYLMRPRDFIENKSSVSKEKTSTEQITTNSSNISNISKPIINTQSIKNNMHTVTIETNKGNIIIETYDADAPKASTNFITLANKGFYNGVIFHRVIKGFMIQGGDPTGTGRGGPGYQFEDELNPNTPSAQEGYKRGVVAMANAGPNTNGSQFFIMHADSSLPHSYTIFGKVVEGLDVVDSIATTEVDNDDRPKSEVKMLKVTAVRKD